MIHMQYSIQKAVTGSYNAVVEKVKSQLIKEGFGILTEINVRETLKKKLNVNYPNYTILGACHPQSAYQVLQKEQEIGLLLPCNVIVYETTDGSVNVSAIKPTTTMQVVENSDIKPIAEEVESKLKRVIDSI